MIDRGRLWPALGVVVLIYGAALVGAVRDSLRPRLGVVSGAAWREVLGDPRFGGAVAFSLRLTILATVLSAIGAIGLAAVLRRSVFLRAVAALPVLVPHLLVAVVAVTWLGPGGVGDRLLGDLPVILVRDGAGWGIVLVYLYKEIPILALLVASAWGPDVDRRSEAAATLGASWWHRLRLVIWPAIRAPLLTGSVIVAAFVFGAFEVPLLLGPTTPETAAVYALTESRSAGLAGRARADVALLVVSAITLLFAMAMAPLIGRGDE